VSQKVGHSAGSKGSNSPEVGEAFSGKAVIPVSGDVVDLLIPNVNTPIVKRLGDLSQSIALHCTQQSR
jgi:hypothetical protein